LHLEVRVKRARGRNSVSTKSVARDSSSSPGTISFFYIFLPLFHAFLIRRDKYVAQ
jgi:hypothetical protein